MPTTNRTWIERQRDRERENEREIYIDRLRDRQLDRQRERERNKFSQKQDKELKEHLTKTQFTTYYFFDLRRAFDDNTT